MRAELIAAYRRMLGEETTLSDDEVAERVEQIATGMTRAVEAFGQAMAEMGKRMQVALVPLAEFAAHLEAEQLAINDGE